MKNFVITIMDNEKSVKVAQRCIDSGKQYGLNIEMFNAFTPQNTNIDKTLNDFKIMKEGFIEKYSRTDNCVAAFLSHFTLWQYSMIHNEEVTIFEHDAVIVNEIPNYISYQGCISLGKPSYGKFKTPAKLGVNPLTSKPYFPGAHAYRLNPKGARQLVSQARMVARPTDVFLNTAIFPWLEEYYPWPVEARDTFTTIQKTEGCLAKHSYNDKYKII